MKLVILGGVAAQKVSTLLKSAADNLEITVYKDLVSFVEQASIRPPQIDRMLIMQDAYTKCEGDKNAAMSQFAHYVSGQFPELRVISIGADPEFLESSSQMLASPLYITLKSTKGSAAFFNDISMLPIDRLRTVYAQSVITSDAESVAVTETVASQPAAPAPQPDKKQGKGLFGRRKDKPSKAGTSPAQSLTAGQGSGFGSNQSSTNPFENNPFANGGNSAFGGTQETANSFESQQSSNPFGAKGTDKASGKAKEEKSNPFWGVNPFASKGTPAEEQEPVEETQTNPFGAQTNPFETQTNPFGAQGDTSEAQLNPFGAMDNSQDIGFSDNPVNPFANAGQNEAQEDTDFGATDNSPFSQEVSEEAEIAQNLLNAPDFSGGVAPVRQAENAVEEPKDDFEEAEIAPSNPFAVPSDIFETPSLNSASEITSDTGNNSEIEEADDSMGFINSPYMQSANSEHNIDMTKLTARGVGDQYNFKEAVADTHQAPKRATTVEEASAQAQMGIIDDTAYQMQTAPTRVIERVVEKEVYIETGGETPAQKLLEAGKQVTIIVTGDRRSGVTYTCLTLASLYAKRISTLVVDLDTETCGGQLYQDLESLLGEEENVQHGVLRAKNATLLSNLVHHDNADGYDYLFSLIGNDPATANDIKAVQSALMSQRNYQLVIVDCPWSKISLLDELVAKSKILVCVDPDITGCHNTVELLNDLQVRDSLAIALERSGAYIAKQGSSVDNLTQNMRWISESFEAKNIDWASMRILGTATREGLIECMKKL